jgi:hypothetical protein
MSTQRAYYVGMGQSQDRYRQSFVVDVITPGMVGQFYAPAPEDPWDESALWGRMGGTRLRIEYTRPIKSDGTLGRDPDGPRDVIAIVQSKDPKGVVMNAKLLLVAADGDVAVEAVELRRRDGQPISRRALGSMGLGAVYKALSNVLHTPIAQAHLGEQWTLKVPIPGRPGRDDLFYAQWARRYVKALEAAPRSPIAHLVATSDNPGTTGDEIRARIRRARERELLTSTPKGRPGGELTDKAKALLRDAGLLEGEGNSSDGER